MRCDYNNNEICIEELLYLIYFGIMFGAKALGLYDGQTVYNVTLVLGFLVWGMKIMVTEHTMYEFGILLGIIGMCFLIYYNTGEKGILIYMTMMLGIKNVDLKKVFHMAACILGSSFLFLVIATALKIKPEILAYSNRWGFGEIIRHSLGYPHTNTLMTTYIVLMALVLISIGNQSRKYLAIMSISLWLGSVYLFLYSCSNTGILGSTIYLILNYYFQTRTSISKLEKKGLYFLYPFLVGIVSIAFPLLAHTNDKVFHFSDKLFHNRIFLSYYYLTEEKWTLFGSRMAEKYYPSGYRYMIDNSFLYSFIQLGIVMGIILSITNMYLIHVFIKEDRRTELAILISFWILGISDPFLYNLAYKNILFLYAGNELYKWLQTTDWNQKSRRKRMLSLKNRTVKLPAYLLQIVDLYKYIKKLIVSIEWRDFFIFIFVVGAVWSVQLIFIGKIEIISNVDKWEAIRYALTVSCLVGGGTVAVSRHMHQKLNAHSS